MVGRELVIFNASVSSLTSNISGLVSSYMRDKTVNRTALHQVEAEAERALLLARAAAIGHVARANIEEIAATQRFIESLQLEGPALGSAIDLLAQMSNKLAENLRGMEDDSREFVDPKEPQGREQLSSQGAVKSVATAAEANAEVRRTRGAKPGGKRLDATSAAGFHVSDGSVGRGFRRSLVHAFMEGLGGVFDIFASTWRDRWHLPTFEETLADDAQALCLALGLRPDGVEGARERTN